jgi:phage FluMu protein Com
MESIAVNVLEEMWIPFPTPESKYEVSSLGRVRNRLTKSIHKINYDDPYPRVSIGKIQRLHRVVAEAFFGKCPTGFEVNHKDSDKTNNCLYNLEYVTHDENMQLINRNPRVDWGKPKLTKNGDNLECKRCGHVWYQKAGGNTPQVCPRCKSYKWNEPKRITNQVKKE